VWPVAEFATRTATLAQRLAAAPQTVVRHLRQSLRASFDRTLDQCLDAEVQAQIACWNSPDVAEGLAAFAEKRAPEFGSRPVDMAESAPSAAARQFE
jgi:enoyl-CoA hydratase/carnithine racemase